MKNESCRLKQAVILAGGKGTRLLPLTIDKPKPMIEFHGKPFLQYLIEQLRDQGIEEVLLLLGYLPDVIKDYFGDGSSFGISICYAVTDPDFDTGTRLRLARNLVQPCFLMLYCDNYWPMNLGKMWDLFAAREDAYAQITAYGNKDHYTKDNLIVDEQGRVVGYDKSRLSPGLHGVDIGYAIMKREVIDLIPAGNVNFEATVYPKLVQEKKLFAFSTEHRYYSVGSHERLASTTVFLERKKVIILDRDGVINVKAPKACYVTNWGEFTWLPGVIEAIRLLKNNGFFVIVVTNQAGIARGFMTESDLQAIHSQMNYELQQYDGKIDAFYYCPHGWDDDCDCRKPKPGMLLAAQRDYHLDLSRIYFIGDDERDREAGMSAGCKVKLVDTQCQLLNIVSEIL